MPYELVHLITIQVIIERRVVRSQFFYTIRAFLKTFNGFQPTRASRRVAFENFVPNRVFESHSSPMPSGDRLDVPLATDLS
jgi:hypothetical protein